MSSCHISTANDYRLSATREGQWCRRRYERKSLSLIGDKEAGGQPWEGPGAGDQVGGGFLWLGPDLTIRETGRRLTDRSLC